MEGATLLSEGEKSREAPRSAAKAWIRPALRSFSNYVALPPIEAFRIEYWAMEEAKLRRQPPEKELSRRIALIVGGGSGIGREVAHLAAAHGAHVMLADYDSAAAGRVAAELAHITQKEFVATTAVDIRSRDAIRDAIRATIAAFGGIDILINTAALFPSSPDGKSATNSGPQR